MYYCHVYIYLHIYSYIEEQSLSQRWPQLTWIQVKQPIMFMGPAGSGSGNCGAQE